MYNSYPYIMPTYNQQPYYRQQQPTLQGKQVDSIEVVRTLDIPLDGSTSYFPLTDGSAIITKQLQANGVSKIRVYKETEDQQPVTHFITEEDLKSIKEDIDRLRGDIRALRGDEGE